MGDIVIDKNELRQIIKDTITSVLVDNKEFLEDTISEAILDLNLGLAIEAGDTGEYVSENTIWDKLDS